MYAIKCLDGSERLVSTIPDDINMIDSFEFNRNELPIPPDDDHQYDLIIDFQSHSFSLVKQEDAVVTNVPETQEVPEIPLYDVEQAIWDKMAAAYNEGVQQA